MKGEKKVKFALEHATKALMGSKRCSSTLSLTSGLDVGGLLTPRSGRCKNRKDPVPVVYGGWVGPRAGLDVYGISCPPPPGFDLGTVQSVTSRYTD